MTMRFSTTSAFNSGISNYAGVTNGSVFGTNGVYTATNGDYTSILESRNNTLQAAESYNIADSGRDAVLSGKISNVCSYIANGQEDYAMEAYNELLDQMMTQTRYSQLVTEDGDDSQLRAVARQLIEAETGVNLEEFIRANTRDAKGVQYQQQMHGADKVDSVSTEDLLGELCDLKVAEEEMKWYDQVGYGLDWFFNPWQRWFSGSRVD